jgi:hypothetical protein
MVFYNHMLMVIILSLFCSTQHVHSLPQGKAIEKRDQVGQCSAILVALKASAFCSSFIGISDVIQTHTIQSVELETVTVCM